jgi:SH3-like domain-containing protein
MGTLILRISVRIYGFVNQRLSGLPNVLTHPLINKSEAMRKAELLLVYTSFFTALAMSACKDKSGDEKVEAALPSSTTVSAPDLKMRIAPNTTAVEIAHLSRGEQVKIVQRSVDPVHIGKYNAHWYKVTNASGLTGWVYGAHLAVESNEGDVKALMAKTEKKLKEAIYGRWDAATITGALTANFVTFMPDGQIEFGINRKALQYGKYEVEIVDNVAVVKVIDIKKPMFTDMKAKMIGDTLVFSMLMDDKEYKLNLADKDPQFFRDQGKKPAPKPATPPVP